MTRSTTGYKLAWHFAGLFLACLGALFAVGWPGLLVTFGWWIVIATTSDLLLEALKEPG